MVSPQAWAISDVLSDGDDKAQAMGKLDSDRVTIELYPKDRRREGGSRRGKGNLELKSNPHRSSLCIIYKPREGHPDFHL